MSEATLREAGGSTAEEGWGQGLREDRSGRDGARGDARPANPAPSCPGRWAPCSGVQAQGGPAAGGSKSGQQIREKQTVARKCVQRRAEEHEKQGSIYRIETCDCVLAWQHVTTSQSFHSEYIILTFAPTRRKTCDHVSLLWRWERWGSWRFMDALEASHLTGTAKPLT